MCPASRPCTRSSRSGRSSATSVPTRASAWGRTTSRATRSSSSRSTRSRISWRRAPGAEECERARELLVRFAAPALRGERLCGEQAGPRLGGACPDSLVARGGFHKLALGNRNAGREPGRSGCVRGRCQVLLASAELREQERQLTQPVRPESFPMVTEQLGDQRVRLVLPAGGDENARRVREGGRKLLSPHFARVLEQELRLGLRCLELAAADEHERAE